MEYIKKYKLSFILLGIFAFLAIFYIVLPSKSKVKEVELKTIQKDITMVDVQSYYVDGSEIKNYTFSTPEDSYSNLLKTAVEDILNKSSLDNKPSLLNIYFSDTSIYFQFNSKNLDPLLKEAIQKTAFELLDISDIKFIWYKNKRGCKLKLTKL